MSSTRTRTTLPPVDSEWHWNKLLNQLFLREQDGLFAWLRAVRAAVEEAERQKREEAA